jgi:lamin tail-like protein
MRDRTFLRVVLGFLTALVCILARSSTAVGAGDPLNLRINEILTSNKKTPPVDLDNQFEDMVEIINPSEDDIKLQNLIITDTVTKDSQGKLHPAGSQYKFLFGSVISKRTILVFCDNDVGANGEPHATFKLNQQGGIVALFAPGDVLIDMVAVPRLAEGTSYARFPDATGTFCHTATPTFKKCNVLTGGCDSPPPNSACSNIPPECNLHSHESAGSAAGANPAAGAEVPVIADVWDEKENPTSIDEVTVVYQVNGGPDQVAKLAYDEEASKLIMVQDWATDPTGATLIQDKNRSIWKGAIPGQAEGSQVTFFIKVKDTDGATGTDPKVICSDTITTDCKTPYRYRVAYTSPSPLVLNEIAPWNTSYFDTSDSTPKTDDYIEIFSPADVDLSGYYLSTNSFRPDDFKFPTGSNIKAGDHLIVWCDGDAGKTGVGPYHTTFKLNKAGDAIFIFDKQENGFGMIDGYFYPAAKEDTTIARCPDGTRSTTWEEEKKGTPKKENTCSSSQGEFIRADSDDSGELDINDPTFTLNYMFLAGPAPRCMDALDSDDNGAIDINDPLYTLNFLFLAGPPPLAPFPARGPDTTSSSLPACQ